MSGDATGDARSAPPNERPPEWFYKLRKGERKFLATLAEAQEMSEPELFSAMATTDPQRPEYCAYVWRYQKAYGEVPGNPTLTREQLWHIFQAFSILAESRGNEEHAREYALLANAYETLARAEQSIDELTALPDSELKWKLRQIVAAAALVGVEARFASFADWLEDLER